MVHKKKKKITEIQPKEIKEEQDQVEISKTNKKARLIIRNLPFKNLSENTVRKLFKEFGEITDISLLKKPDGKFVGCGFVEFTNRRSAANAIFNVNGKQLSGRPVIVDWAIPKSSFIEKVKTLQPEIKTDDIKEDNSETSELKFNTCDSNEVDDAEIDKDDDDEDEFDDDDFDEVEEKPKIQLSNDVEEGKTIFVKNIPFSVTNDELKTFFQVYGDIFYAVICIDKLTEHSKGSGFVKFKVKESADKSIKDSGKIQLQEQVLEVTRAVARDKLQDEKKKKKKIVKDSRNLYLVREGVVMANSPAAETVSSSDMAKRLQIEQWKTQILRNLNMFVAKTRLVVHNLPSDYNDAKLRSLFEKYSPAGAVVREARVMTDKKHVDLKGNPISKEIGFVSFTTHEDALDALRLINNNPAVFTPNKRPIISFSIENKQILNMKQKRMEKSRAKLAADKKMLAKGKELEKFNRKQRRFLRRKQKIIQKRQEAKKIKREQGDVTDISSASEPPKKKKKIVEKTPELTPKTFLGAVAEPGKMIRLRSKSKLKQQAEMHKAVKKKLKNANKLKQLKKVSNKSAKVKEELQKKKKKVLGTNDNKLSNIISKHKKKIDSSSKKWYEN